MLYTLPSLPLGAGLPATLNKTASQLGAVERRGRVGLIVEQPALHLTFCTFRDFVRVPMIEGELPTSLYEVPAIGSGAS
jgi:hypothetical protein